MTIHQDLTRRTGRHLYLAQGFSNEGQNILLPWSVGVTDYSATGQYPRILWTRMDDLKMNEEHHHLFVLSIFGA